MLLIAFILKIVNLVTRGEYYVAVGLHILLTFAIYSHRRITARRCQSPRILHSKPGIWLASPLPSPGSALALLGLAWLAASILYGKI